MSQCTIKFLLMRSARLATNDVLLSVSTVMVLVTLLVAVSSFNGADVTTCLCILLAAVWSDLALMASLVVTVPMAMFYVLVLRVNDSAKFINVFPVVAQLRHGITGELMRPSETPTMCFLARCSTRGSVVL